MAKKTLKKAKVVKQSAEMPIEQAPDQWGEKLVRFFDEFEVGMDAVWYGKEIDLDEVDSYYFMSGYEVLSLFPELSVMGTGRTDMSGGLEQIIRTKKGIASFAHLHAASGSFRYALPYEGDLT
jgi:hypothetical protein